MRHYSPRTAEAYLTWIRRFILFHNRQHPAQLGAPEVSRFLSSLAVKGRVSASTQNQALAAILFLYSKVLGLDIGSIENFVRAKKPLRLPVVMTRDEVSLVLSKLKGLPLLMASLLYGSGLRLSECLCLRIKDLDFANNQIDVRDGKGCKDRATLLPRSLEPSLKAHLLRVRKLHETDRAQGAGFVELPGALDRKYPNAPTEWRWQWVFPATRLYVHESSGQRRRHHLHETALQRVVHNASSASGVTKPISCHTFRHSFEAGYDIRTIQKLLGHRDVRTTMIYTHVLNRGALGVISPLDAGAARSTVDDGRQEDS